MKNLINPNQINQKFFIITLFIMLMLLTRGSHFLTAYELPDATFILMFAGGIFLRRFKYFLSLIFISIMIDYFSLDAGIVISYLFNFGYLGLIATYSLIWVYASKLSNDSITKMPLFLINGFLFLLISFLGSSLTFYFLSGWPIFEKNLLEFLVQHAPSFILANLTYLVIMFTSKSFIDYLHKFRKFKFENN
ncbi:MAG: hypothetical protein VW545_04155 [Pelagibacteraceae bacterium]